MRLNLKPPTFGPPSSATGSETGQEQNTPDPTSSKSPGYINCPGQLIKCAERIGPSLNARFFSVFSHLRAHEPLLTDDPAAQAETDL